MCEPERRVSFQVSLFGSFACNCHDHHLFSVFFSSSHFHIHPPFTSSHPLSLTPFSFSSSSSPFLLPTLPTGSVSHLFRINNTRTEEYPLNQKLHRETCAERTPIISISSYHGPPAASRRRWSYPILRRRSRSSSYQQQGRTTSTSYAAAEASLPAHPAPPTRWPFP